MRQISGTHFFKSFSDGLFRAFRGSRAGSAPTAYTAYTHGAVASGGERDHSLSALSAPRGWLNEVSWEKVLTTNHSQCQLQSTQTTPNPKSYDSVRAEWEQRVQQEMLLEQALEFCRQCEQKAPFVFSNSSTFAQIGKTLVEDIARNLPSVEAHIVRNTAAHYVTGMISKKELLDILGFYERQWRPGLAKLSENGVGERPHADT